MVVSNADARWWAFEGDGQACLVEAWHHSQDLRILSDPEGVTLSRYGS